MMHYCSQVYVRLLEATMGDPLRDFTSGMKGTSLNSSLSHSHPLGSFSFVDGEEVPKIRHDIKRE